MARAKGQSYATKKGKARRNDNTAVGQKRRVQSPKIVSSQDATAVGRPGFGGNIPGPVDGKTSVKRVMMRDPARGITTPAADKITTTNVDLVGPVNPNIVTDSVASNPSPPNTGQRVIRPTPKSQPVRSTTPGKVVRPRSR